MAKIKVKDLQIGMTITTDIYDPNGHLLLGNGCELNEKHIDVLKTWGEISVQINDDVPQADDEIIISPDTYEEEFNLVETISEIASLFSVQLERKGVDFILSIKPIIPVYLYGDQKRFRQIIIDLLANAEKFTESGEIYLTLILNVLEDDFLDLQVSVKDTGMGISEKSIEKISESFEQEEINNSRDYDESLSRLTLCHKRVKMMGGDIRVESTLGEGSEFIFNVKIKRVVNAPEAFALEESNVFHILYITESDKKFGAVSSVFEILGIQYAVCSSDICINKQLKKLDVKNTNLILIDESTLNAKGWNVAEVKAKYEQKGLSIAVVCYEKNKDAYKDIVEVITKPFQIDELSETLKKRIEQTDVVEEQKSHKAIVNTSNLDVNMIDNLKEMMGDAYDGLVDTYITRSSQLINEIINHNDIEELIKNVHSLKGSSGTMGAKKIFSLCGDFELSIRTGKKDNIKRVIEDLSDELSLVHEYLRN